MKKIIRVLLFILIVNIFCSFAFAGVGDEPRPVSIEPVSMVEITTVD